MAYVHESIGKTPAGGGALTGPMMEQLELMRQHVISHEQQIREVMTAETHLQMLVKSLGFSTAAQDGRVTGLEQHAAQLASSVEALRAFQERQYSGPPAAAFSGGGFPVGGGLSSACSPHFEASAGSPHFEPSPPVRCGAGGSGN